MTPHPARVSHIHLLCGGQVLCWQRQPAPIDLAGRLFRRYDLPAFPGLAPWLREVMEATSSDSADTRLASSMDPFLFVQPHLDFTRRHQTLFVRLRGSYVLGVMLVGVTMGCQQNGGKNAFRWPWQTPPNNSAQASGQSVTSTEPSAVQGSEQTEFAQLVDLMKRQNEQARLSAQQRDQLARLTNLAKQQSKSESLAYQQRQEEQLRKLQAQANELVQQKQKLGELQRKSLELDSNNRDLHSQLARSQQQYRLVEDQLKLTRQQLQDTTERLSETMNAKLAADNRASALNAAIQRRGSANIAANRSAQQKLSPVTIADLKVQQDGDVIRIELPSHRLFVPYSATLTPDALLVIDQVAASVSAEYGQQKIGIEAHTDNAQLQGNNWRSNHQLSAAQSMAVFEQLVQRHGFATQQLFILGHGPNYPIASNATPAGQQQNRRVEIVIYPEAWN